MKPFDPEYLLRRIKEQKEKANKMLIAIKLSKQLEPVSKTPVICKILNVVIDTQSQSINYKICLN